MIFIYLNKTAPGQRVTPLKETIFDFRNKRKKKRCARNAKKKKRTSRRETGTDLYLIRPVLQERRTKRRGKGGDQGPGNSFLLLKYGDKLEKTNFWGKLYSLLSHFNSKKNIYIYI